MKTLFALVSYLAAVTAVISGCAVVVMLIVAEPSESATASAEVRQAPVPPKIAVWLARKAIPLPPQENEFKPPAVIPVYRHPVQETIRIQQPIARVTTRVLKNEQATRALQNDGALAYDEPRSSSASEAPFLALRDRRERHGD